MTRARHHRGHWRHGLAAGAQSCGRVGRGRGPQAVTIEPEALGGVSALLLPVALLSLTLGKSLELGDLGGDVVGELPLRRLAQLPAQARRTRGHWRWVRKCEGTVQISLENSPEVQGQFRPLGTVAVLGGRGVFMLLRRPRKCLGWHGRPQPLLAA